MKDNGIKCPKCGTEIEVAGVLRNQLRQEMEAEVMQSLKAREDRLSKLETTLEGKDKEIELQRESLESMVAERVAGETKKLRDGIEKRVRENMGVELKDLQAQLAEKQAAAETAQKQELELRKRTREAEEKQKALQLEVDRRVDEECQKAAANAKKDADDQHHLKVREKELVIADLRKALENATRRAEQGSMERQGEVMEMALESLLAQEFTTDVFDPVGRGVQGCDVIHRVSEGGRDCGMILWESKNAKAWNDKWIAKLKDDQRAKGAAIAVLVTNVMPDGLEVFGCREGVWVTRMPAVKAVAYALRRQLIEVSYAHRASEGKNENIEILCRYFSGPEFRNRIQAIVEALISMKAQLDQEQRAMTKIWKSREQLISRVMTNTAGFYGDMQGLLGGTMPQIRALELAVVSPPKQLASHSNRPSKK